MQETIHSLKVCKYIFVTVVVFVVVVFVAVLFIPVFLPVIVLKIIIITIIISGRGIIRQEFSILYRSESRGCQRVEIQINVWKWES